MKIGGVELKGPNKDYLVIPRPDGDVVFWAETVRDFSEFTATCPLPSAPGIRTKDGFKKDVKDPTYREMMHKYEEARFAWLCVKSLTPSNIEWDKVDVDRPMTCVGWVQELLDAGLSEVECNRIITLVTQVNSLDEAKLQEARELFARGQQEAASESSGQSTEQPSI